MLRPKLRPQNTCRNIKLFQNIYHMPTLLQFLKIILCKHANTDSVHSYFFKPWPNTNTKVPKGVQRSINKQYYKKKIFVLKTTIQLEFPLQACLKMLKKQFNYKSTILQIVIYLCKHIQILKILTFLNIPNFYDADSRTILESYKGHTSIFKPSYLISQSR